MRQAGFAVYAPAANPAIKDRVASVNAHLCNASGVRRYFVNDQECPRTAEALEQQVYGNNGMPDKSGGLDHACFSAETLVQTEKGAMRIDEMPESGYVYTVGGRKVPYSGCQQTKVAKMVKVILSNGSEIKCTPDHMFLTTEGWIEAANLRGKKICQIRSLSLPLSSHSKGLNIIGETKGRNIMLDSMLLNTAQFNTFIGLFGGSIMEKFRQIITSITEIEIHRIMSSRILKCFRPRNIQVCTMKNAKRQIWMGMSQPCGKELTMQENSPLSGMVRMKGGNGILNMQKLKFSEILKRSLLLLARSAHRLSSPSTQELNIVQTSAVRSPVQGKEEPLESIMRRGIANIAQNPLFAGNILGLDSVAVSAVQEIDGDYPVYCLKVPEWGCFALADGTIVSNCDALGYFLHYHFPIASVTGFSTTRAQYA
jgi:hypothetical protein